MQLNAAADYTTAYKVCDSSLMGCIVVLISDKEIHYLPQNAYVSSSGAYFGY
jgi:hypothetical protein